MTAPALSELFTVAEKYRQNGYHPIPVRVNGVKPNGDKDITFPAEYKGVTFDRPEQYEGYNGLAIDTGRSGVVAIDVDENPAKGKQGFANLAAAGITLPPTRATVTTWSGGKHYLYRPPAGVTIPSNSDGRLAKDVDVRGNGGGVLFVAPTTVGDKPYQWDNGPVAVRDLPELPAAFAERLLGTNREYQRPSFIPEVEVTPIVRERAVEEIDRQLRVIAEAGPGERWSASSVLTRVAGIVLALGDDPDKYESQILEAYQESGGDDEDRCIDSYRRALTAVDPEDLSKWLPEGDRRELFWQARPELRHIRQAANARAANPFAALGVVLVRALATLPPSWRMDTGVGDPDGGIPNLFVAIAARSGKGKGAATSVAKRLWPLPSTVTTGKPGSGEALARMVRRRDEQLGAWTVPSDASAIVDLPEVKSLLTAASRSGNTIVSELCAAWSGESLGTYVADTMKTEPVPEGSYRMGLVGNIQDGNATGLLDDAASTTGLTQRLVWFEGYRARPTVVPEWPGSLKTPQPPISGGLIKFPREAREEMFDSQYEEGDVDPVDTHLLYTQAKVAVGLAVISGRWAEVTPEDWWLAGLVMEESIRVRNSTLDALREAAGKRATARRVHEAEADDAAFEINAARYADALYSWLAEQDGATRNMLRHRLRSNKRDDYFEPVLERLLDEGRVKAGDTDWFTAV